MLFKLDAFYLKGILETVLRYHLPLLFSRKYDCFAS